MSESQLCPKCGKKLNIFWRDSGSRVYQCTNESCDFEAENEEDYRLKLKSIDDNYTIKNLRIMLQNSDKTTGELRQQIVAQQQTITRPSPH
jgi:ssDNA-binding Zn-finger/Zn-ribbon topoisomerase 1